MPASTPIYVEPSEAMPLKPEQKSLVPEMLTEDIPPILQETKPQELKVEEPMMQEMPEVKKEKTPNFEPYFLRKPVIQEVQEKEETKPEPSTRHFPFDAMTETPTLLQQRQQKELHEAIGENKESLNDKLKQERIELAHHLKEAPVKDLRKAIGINDKFLFVNELFRGDEGMYDRSIKTINNFHILPEAEYWINRELKVKLGWNDSKETVQHFYSLVRRRFS
jgi:hypothetical protein